MPEVNPPTLSLILLVLFGIYFVINWIQLHRLETEIARTESERDEAISIAKDASQ